jgi:hypothetical protein
VLRALAVAAAAAPVLTAPDGYVPAQPHVSSVAAHLEVRGRAPRGTVVPISVRCELGPCSVSAVANRRRRFEATLDVVLPHGAVAVRVRFGGESEVFPLDLPQYAASSPYVDDARVPELNMIGDSLAVGTDLRLRAQLPGWRVTTNGVESRPLAAGMSVLEQTRLPRRPRALAFSLFTNDDPRAVDALETAVRASLDRLGRRDCALWATIVRPKLAGVSYGAANARLRALAAEDDRLRIVDWARAVRRNRGWLSDDGVHPTAEGYAERARLFARAARRCAADNGWRLASGA